MFRRVIITSTLSILLIASPAMADDDYNQGDETDPGYCTQSNEPNCGDANGAGGWEVDPPIILTTDPPPVDPSTLIEAPAAAPIEPSILVEAQAAAPIVTEDLSFAG